MNGKLGAVALSPLLLLVGCASAPKGERSSPEAASAEMADYHDAKNDQHLYRADGRDLREETQARDQQAQIRLNQRRAGNTP